MMMTTMMMTTPKKKKVMMMMMEDGEEEDKDIMKDASGYAIIRPSEGTRKMKHLLAFRTTGKYKG